MFLAIGVSGQNLKPNNVNILSTDKLSKGMKFYGLSTLGPSGHTKFTGKILGVLNGSIGPGHKWIIAAIDGNDFRETGVIAGQSGSPVFVKMNGKKYFIGTVSYAEEFPKNAIAYLTPANELIESGSYSPETAPATSPSLASKKVSEFLESQGQMEMGRLMERGVISVSTLSAPPPKKALPKVTSGDVLSVQLAYGDFNFGSFGTVSYVNGSEIYLFGHPMFQLGPVEYRLAPA